MAPLMLAVVVAGMDMVAVAPPAAVVLAEERMETQAMAAQTLVAAEAVTVRLAVVLEAQGLLSFVTLGLSAGQAAQ